MKLQTQNSETATFTQGDDTVLSLRAIDDSGIPIDLTGATFSTQILGENGMGSVTFPDDQHTIDDQIENLGGFNLTLSESDTALCGEGTNKQIISLIIFVDESAYYQGFNLLTVYASIPFQ